MTETRVLIITRCQVVLRFAELPSTNPSEIESMAEFYAIRELPYTKQEIIASFRNLGSYKKGFSYIMLAIVRRQQIEEMMAQKEARPESIRLETESLYLYLLKKRIVKQGKVSLIINIQKYHSEIMIIDGMRPIFSRGLSDSGTLLEEISRSMISYEADGANKEAEEVIIMHGSDSNIENIKPGLKALFSFPVNFYEDKWDLNNLDLALEIDLLPPEYIYERVKRGVVKQIFLTGLLFFITVFVLISFFIFKLR